MRVLFHKLCDERHRLEIIRDDGAREAVECETRSYLLHDFLHYAVESEAGIDSGFWGNLQRGRTLAELDDRAGQARAQPEPELMRVEQVVGALSSLTKGRAPDALLDSIRAYARSIESSLPDWLTNELVTAVQERMRRLIGRWKATPFGSAMELRWPE